MYKRTDKKYRFRAAAILTALTLATSACSVSNAQSTSASALTGTVSTSAGTTISQTATKTVGNSAAATVPTATAASEMNTQIAAPVVEYSSKDLTAAYDESAATSIVFSATGVKINGEGASSQDSRVTISDAGIYVVSGGSADGQLVVESPKDADVVLVLDGLDLTNPSGPALRVIQADKVIVTLPEGSVSTLSDGAAYTTSDSETDEPDGAIYSKADLTVNGMGTLNVNGNYRHGIVSKDDLKIISGTLNIKAVADGLKGKDMVAIQDGTVTVVAGGDGIQSDNEEDSAKGFVWIESGTFQITAGLDGIQAQTSLTVQNGRFNITTGGGSANSSQSSSTWGKWQTPGAASTAATSDSAKGLKAGAELSLSGGTLTIDSSDDSIHSNGNVTIAGGAIQIASGDDAIHADQALLIKAGDIYITSSFEGLEGATVTIRDGKLHVGAMDDGINTSGGADGSSVSGRPGQNGFDASDGSSLTITGGEVFIEAEGDGIDSNGDIVMTGGTVIVNGPTNNGNGAVDYNGSFTLTGGTILALGSSGMAQNVSAASTQPAFLLNLSALPAGTLAQIADASGEELISFTSAKPFSSILYSSAQLKTGASYSLLTGGTATGTAENGVFEKGTWSGGTQLTTVEMTSAQTTIGGSGMGPGGGGMSPGKRP